MYDFIELLDNVDHRIECYELLRSLKFQRKSCLDTRCKDLIWIYVQERQNEHPFSIPIQPSKENVINSLYSCM